MCPDTILRRQVFLRITCQICYNHLCQICYKPSFVENFSQTLFSEKIICLLAHSWNHIHSFMEIICLRGKRLFLSTWLRHVVLELLKRLFFASAAGRRVGQGAKCLQRGKITLSLRKLANKAMRIPQNLLRVYNMLMKLIIITIICHHHISSSWHLLYNFPSKNK